MSVGVHISDPVSKNRARVTNENTIQVIDAGVPIFGQPTLQVIYRDYFRDSAGSNDMRVVPPGGGTEFSIPAPSDNDRERFICSLSFVIADGGASLNQFGAIGVLTNGIDIEYSSTEAPGGVVSLTDGGFKTNFDFIQLSGGQPAFGSQLNAFRGSNVIGNSEAYIPFVNLKTIFGIKTGVRLRAASADRFIIRINDDISAIEQFTCIASGFDRLNPEA